MLLLQVADPYSNVETGNQDWIFALIFISVLAFYILFCVLVARYAKNRGRSFAGFFLLSFFFNPLIGFIIAAIAGGETQKQREDRIRREAEIRMQVENQYRQQYYGQTPPIPTNDGDSQEL